MRLNFSTRTINVEDCTLSGSIGEMENAVIAFFWVGDSPKLGGLSVTLPDRSGSQLLGDRDEMLSRMMGERIASQFQKIALVSTNLPIGFEGREVLRLLNELLSERIEES